MNKFSNVVLHILALPFVLFGFIILLVLWVFRQLVRIRLQEKYGDQFGGLLISSDKAFAPKYEKCRKISMLVLYLRSDRSKNMVQDMRQLLLEKIYNNNDTYQKFSSTCHSYFGQEYLLKNQVGVSDILKVLPMPSKGVPFDDEYIKRTLGKISNDPLPKDDTALWEVSVTNQPLLDANVKGYVYPIIFRINHITADGIRLVHFISNLFGNDPNVNYSDRLIKEESKSHNNVTELINMCKQAIYVSYLILIAPIAILKITFLKKSDENALHESKMSGEKLIAWATERNSGHVNTVKKIKNTIPNTRFSDVLFACISASFFSYFKKKSFETPKKVSCMIPLVSALTTERRRELKNDFTFGFLELPILDPTKFLDGLEDVKRSIKELRDNPNREIVYLWMKYGCAPLPGPLIDFLFNTSAHTCSISIVPGTAFLKVLEDCEVIRSFASAPHTNNTGVTLTICTYDNKFHVCLFVDKAVMSKQEDVQFIADEFMKQISELKNITENLSIKNTTSRKF